MEIDGTTVAVEIAPNDGLYATSPTMETLAGVRHVEAGLSGRTDQLDTLQAGTTTITVDIRNRVADLTHGPAAVTFDGSGSDYWSAGDLAAFSGATELDLRACIAADDWSPSAAMTFMGQWNATGNQRAWQFDIDTSGYLSLALSSSGSAATSVINSGARAAAVDGQVLCVRVTWQSSDGATQFYVKRLTTPGRARAACVSHLGWMPLGTVKTSMTAGVFNSTAAVTVGDRVGATQPFDGRVLYADARTAIGSDTLRFAFWPGDAASTAATSWTASAGAGETWTKVGSSTVRVQGDYYSRVNSGTPVRLVAERGGNDYELWYGYVRATPQQFGGGGVDATADFFGTDAIGFMAEQIAPGTPSQFGTGTIGHYWPLHESNAVQQASDVVGAAPGTWSKARASGGPTQPGAPDLTTQALIEGTYLVTAESAACDLTFTWLKFSFHLDREGSIFRVMCGDGANTLGVNYGVGGDYYFQAASAISADRFDVRLSPGWHTFEMFSSNGGALAYFDGMRIEPNGVTATIFGTSAALYVDGSASAVSDVALYEDSSDNSGAYLGASGGAGQTSAERVTSLLHAAMGNTPTLWDLTTDVSTYLGPTALATSYGELFRQVATAEQGLFHQDAAGVVTFRSRIWSMTATEATVSQATFGDGPGEVAYANLGIDPGSRVDVINDVTVTLPNGAVGSYTDWESVERHGLRSLRYAAPLATPADAVGLAKHIVGMRAWPRERITNMVLNPLGKPDCWTQVLTRKQGDRITVVRRTNATTEPMSAQVIIDRISHSIDRSGSWLTTFSTSPAPMTAAEAGYFTLDDPVLGMLDAGNVLAY